EVEGVEQVVMNDLNPEAVQLARFNVEYNGLSDRVVITNIEANTLLNLYSSPDKRFDVVDLDPFGSPSPFIESAIRALHNNGMIALTATDTAPLCGVHPEACLRKYFGRPLRTEYCHELAVRLLTSCLALSAARHGFGINILLSHSTDHYVRVYAQIRRGAELANESLGKIGYILHCFNCLHRKVSLGITSFPMIECDRCGGRMDVAGPLWLGELSNLEFCSRMREDAGKVSLSEAKRVERLLSHVLREVDGPPTYFVVDKVSEKMGLPTPSKSKVIQSLIERGYRAAPTHFNPRGVKSNAPIEIVEEVVEKLIHT
ncbi:MAG: tRNA (guanine(10)-N(2))-dimethyltransferase, partial [Candidatus Bathyarchaeia archaeon]